MAVRDARENGLQHVCLDYGQTGGIWKRGHQRRRATMAAAMTTIGALHSSRFRIEIQDGAREGKKGRSGFSSNSSSTSLSSAIRLDWLFLGFLPLFSSCLLFHHSILSWRPHFFLFLLIRPSLIACCPTAETFGPNQNILFFTHSTVSRQLPVPTSWEPRRRRSAAAAADANHN